MKFIGIDYSGKGKPHHKHTAIQVFIADENGAPQQVARSWSRQGVYHYLRDMLAGDEPVIIGIDHGLSFPLAYFTEHHLASWDEFLHHFVHHWSHAETEEVMARLPATLPYKDDQLLRLTEQFTQGAKSVLHLNPTAITVSFSTHAGLVWLAKLREQLHVWPFDGFVPPAGKSVIAEVYPALYYNRFTYPPELTRRDERDAYAICRWLQQQYRDGTLSHYWSLPTVLAKQRVQLEGWILGVL